MIRTATAILLATLCSGCSTPDLNFTASTLRVSSTSIGHNVLADIPLESVMERVDMMSREGKQISYVAFTDTDYGGLLFLDDKLYGTIQKRDAHAFYSCRGYASARSNYWAREASDWIDLLIATTTPVTHVKLNFSGKPAMQSIKEVAGNPMLSDAKSLIGMGTNPLNIFSTLNTTRSNVMERKKYERALQALGNLAPGDKEAKLARIAQPEDVSFTSDGMVMAYPSYLQDFYVSEEVIKVRQQPSFLRLSHNNAAIFYIPGLLWDQCNPHSWRQALPPDWKPPSPD